MVKRHHWMIRRNSEEQVQIAFCGEEHNTIIVLGGIEHLDSLVKEIEMFKSFDKAKTYGRGK